MRIPVTFHKEVPGKHGQVLDVPGSMEAIFLQEDILSLGDARDESFRRVDTSGDTRILIPIPIKYEEPKLRLPCGCLVAHPGKGGHVVECRCTTPTGWRGSWAIRCFRGETTVQQHDTWTKPSPDWKEW